MKEAKLFSKTNILIAIVVVVIVAALIVQSIRPSVEDYSDDLSSDFDKQAEFIKRNLISGGPPKDGIPSIDSPVYLSADEASQELSGDDIVFGVDYNGFVAAYPKDILYWHEIVNEKVDGQKIAVTYCPLTESIIGYKDRELGVSGELYNSNLVMYDRETDARIPQILGMGIEGEIKGTNLETFPVQVTTWNEWKTMHPNTKVLSRTTGFNRDYDRNPYPGYDNLLRVWFPLVAESDDLRTKDLVLGIQIGEEFLAIQKDGFKEKYPNGLDVELAGQKLKIIQNEKLGNLEVEGRNDINYFEVYWFAWYAYHPTTKLIKTE